MLFESIGTRYGPGFTPNVLPAGNDTALISASLKLLFHGGLFSCPDRFAMSPCFAYGASASPTPAQAAVMSGSVCD